MRTDVLVATAVLAFAAVVDPALQIFSPVSVAYAQTRNASMGVTRTGSGRMSLDVQGAEVRTVFRSIAEFSGRNIVVGKDVKGQVSLQLKDVPWREALTSVCRTQGLDVVEEGSVLRIDEAAKLQGEVLARQQNESQRETVAPLDTRVVKVGYAKAEEIRILKAEKATKEVITPVVAELLALKEK